MLLFFFFGERQEQKKKKKVDGAVRFPNLYFLCAPVAVSGVSSRPLSLSCSSSKFFCFIIIIFNDDIQFSYYEIIMLSLREDVTLQ